MRRKFFLVFSVLSLAIASLLTTIGTDNVEANTTLQNRIKSIQEERSDNQSELEKKETEMKQLERNIKKLDDEIRKIDHQAAETNQKIRLKDSEIEATEQRIEDLIEEIRILEERIAERDDLLKNRVRSMYKNGGSVNYLEVILGAQSFGDLINRISALNTIAQQDRNILEAHHNDKMMVEEVKEFVEEELLALQDQLAELEVLKATLEKQRIEKDRLMVEFEKQEGQLQAELGDLEETESILAAQERAMKQELEAWKERQKKLEEERKRQAELAARSGTTANTTPNVTVEGQFMRPATGSVTSLFGPRWGTFHYGIDIGKGGRTGDVPIVSVEAGTVIRSYYSASYGNTVMISHNVNGQVVTTLYAHLENRLVSDGQRVEKGQLLGYMGNTGRSFGAHLHFEIHLGPWNVAKSNAVDPLKYIPR